MTARAELATLRGDLTTAGELYGRAERVYAGDDPKVYGRSLAELWADRGVNLDAALALAESDLAARQDIGAYDTYAWVLYRLGRHEDANEAIKVATQYRTQDGELLFHEAMISAAIGDTDRATDVLAELTATNPEFHPIQRHIAARTLEALSD